METIWKYSLETIEKQVINVPIGAEILTVQEQFNEPVLWAKVDSGEKTEERHIEIFGTGSTIPEDMGAERKYIATYQLDGGTFIGHVFERVRKTRIVQRK